METYDIVMLVILVGTALFGAIKGFAWQLASIASIVVSYIVAFNFREQLGQSINADPPWNQFLAMLILFVGTSLVIWVGFRMVSNTIDRLRLKEFDRQIGALFGLAKGGLYCILVTLFAVTLLGDTVRGKIVESKSGRYIASILDRSEAVIPEEIQSVLRPYLERFDQRFQGTAGSDPGGLLGGSGFLGGDQSTPFGLPGGVIPDSYWDLPSDRNQSSSAASSTPQTPSQPAGYLPLQQSAGFGQPSGYQQPVYQQPVYQQPYQQPGYQQR